MNLICGNLTYSGGIDSRRLHILAVLALWVWSLSGSNLVVHLDTFSVNYWVPKEKNKRFEIVVVPFIQQLKLPMDW